MHSDNNPHYPRWSPFRKDIKLPDGFADIFFADLETGWPLGLICEAQKTETRVQMIEALARRLQEKIADAKELEDCHFKTELLERLAGYHRLFFNCIEASWQRQITSELYNVRTYCETLLGKDLLHAHVVLEEDDVSDEAIRA